MDIIDIMLAKALTPQGKTDAYVAKANKAAQKAAKAEQDAASAIASVTAAAETIATAQEDAADLLAAAQEALETAQSAQINVPVLYTTTGQNEDGTMTQKAITDALAAKASASDLAAKANTADVESALANKADVSALAAKADASALTDYATKTYVDEAVAQGGGNATISFNQGDSGHITVIGSNGDLVAGTVTEEALIEALLQTGTFIAQDAVGLDIDYANRTFTRTQEAANKSMGNDFNSYSMYGGRTKCNVADDGTINAFYGENGYTEDGSNGQVMIYQPKFYYKRIFRTTEELANGTAVRHETLIISPTAQQGFKLAPIFKGDLDYVLLPAYDAGLVNSKLVSIAGVKPVVNLTVAQAEAYATARGTGWHIMNMAAEATNQMLEIVEFGTMNGQAAIEQGITYLPDGASSTCSFITGSTASIGNGTGHADSTQYDVNGTVSTANADGRRAITYRGMENPWGNLWSMIGGIDVHGSSASQGGAIYICKDFNYTPGILSNNYESIGFNLPSVYGWINAMGKGTDEYDWVYMPIECSQSASSSAPVGDNLWTVGTLNGTMAIATGGSFGYKEDCGPFYYAADRTVS